MRWWRSQLVAYIFQLQPNLQNRVDEIMKSFNQNDNNDDDDDDKDDEKEFQCTAVHIRRGDKIQEDPSQAKVEEFIEAAKEFKHPNIIIARFV